MQRHEQIIELSNHVKNKLKQHQYLPTSSSFINSSDEFIEVDSIYDGHDSLVTTSEPINRNRSETFTTYQVKELSDSFFTLGKTNQPANNSLLLETYTKQQICQQCIHRDRIIHYERQRLLRLYDENKQLHEQLNSSLLLNHQYETDIQNMKHHLKKVNGHLYDYRLNYDQLKQKLMSENKRDEEKIEHEDKQESTMEHLKRLRYEVNMYNRLIAAKQQQEYKRI
ncbi:hypothetical protein I4U23_017718 [Adineta vaga]|nr:hypothetical protein I4U23_017718 [Adineta vaga]